ncbi:MAG: hypothetical protein HGA28_07070 [Anaerolineaceae bacterium]|nr:hypothetical protein [Anaerolineaceae bacterium]
MTRERSKRRKHRKRPLAATIIVLLAIGEILLRLYWVTDYVLKTRLWESGLSFPFWDGQSVTPAGLDFSASAFRLLWLLVAIVVLIGLLRMKRWSWVMLVFWTSISLSIGILHYFYRSLSPFNPADFAVMATDMLLVFALNQSDIQRLYGIRKDDSEPIG